MWRRTPKIKIILKNTQSSPLICNLNIYLKIIVNWVEIILYAMLCYGMFCYDEWEYNDMLCQIPTPWYEIPMLCYALLYNVCCKICQLENLCWNIFLNKILKVRWYHEKGVQYKNVIYLLKQICAFLLINDAKLMSLNESHCSH